MKSNFKPQYAYENSAAKASTHRDTPFNIACL